MRSALLLSLTIILFIALCGLASTPALAKDHGRHHQHPRVCSKTATAAYLACYNEKTDDYWIANGNCYNSAEEDQDGCFADAKGEYKEAKGECQDQLDARKDLCDELGEDAYDPQIDPVNFVDPAEIGDGVAPNPYFPLVPGTRWVYETRDGAGNLLERDTVVVTGETKEIQYPAESGKIFTCAVVHDVVEEYDEGEDTFTVTEDTLDWYAQEKMFDGSGNPIPGNVWYFGEISQTLEDGDLVDIEGSWKAGVDSAKPGILMEADPQVGDVYRQEFALGDAEDWAKVGDLEADEIVPAADCEGECMQTEEGTPLEPDVIEYKYYKPDIGTVLETTPEGERTELVDYTTP